MKAHLGEPVCLTSISPLVAAWGLPKGKAETRRQMDKRFNEIKALLFGQLSALRVTTHGYPEHPLYLRGDLVPLIYT